MTVYNTLNNHYQTIPTRYRTTVENEPSGLIGPVAITLEAFRRGAQTVTTNCAKKQLDEYRKAAK